VHRKGCQQNDRSPYAVCRAQFALGSKFLPAKRRFVFGQHTPERLREPECSLTRRGRNPNTAPTMHGQRVTYVLCTLRVEGRTSAVLALQFASANGMPGRPANRSESLLEASPPNTAGRGVPGRLEGC
jgi:hypothetical protein